MKLVEQRKCFTKTVKTNELVSMNLTGILNAIYTVLNQNNFIGALREYIKSSDTSTLDTIVHDLYTLKEYIDDKDNVMLSDVRLYMFQNDYSDDEYYDKDVRYFDEYEHKDEFTRLVTTIDSLIDDIEFFFDDNEITNINWCNIKIIPKSTRLSNHIKVKFDIMYTRTN